MPKRLLAALGIAITLAAISPLCSADELTPAKRADIKTLMELTGAYGIANQFADLATGQVVRGLKAKNPNFPQKGIDVIRDELTKLFKEEMSAPGGLAEQMIPIYGNHFTHGEVKDLVTFYKSPLGNKLYKEMPLVLRESLQAGQQWGNTLGPKIDSRLRARLKDEGVEIAAPTSPSPPAQGPAPATPSSPAQTPAPAKK
jgi:uncharacterized protein